MKGEKKKSKDVVKSQLVWSLVECDLSENEEFDRRAGNVANYEETNLLVK